jgi:maleate isomerase
MPFMDFGGSDLATAAGVIRQVVREHPEADAVFVSCPHWAVAKAVGPLERELGVAIVASSLAISWHALRRCGVEDRIDGYGRLLSEF